MRNNLSVNSHDEIKRNDIVIFFLSLFYWNMTKGLRELLYLYM